MISTSSSNRKEGKCGLSSWVGDKFKSIITGATYVLKKIKDKMMVLREDLMKKS